VEDVLRVQSDVAEKLRDADLSAENHAFVWATIGSPVEVQTVLDGVSRDLPRRAPTLPTGVTHVWIVSGYSSTRGLAFFPAVGWHEIPFRWPQSPATFQLTQPE
jgi:hypothetical protein